MFITSNLINLDDKDQILTISNLSWEEYIKISDNNQTLAKVSYLNGEIKLVSPSLNHEKIKEFITYLIETYCDLKDIDFYHIGSTTLRSQEKNVGKEPDCSYCFGTDKSIPDLAVEVVFSSGNPVTDLEKYKLLGVKEVWFWLVDHLEIYFLVEDKYSLVVESEYLPGLKSILLSQKIPKVLSENPREVKQEIFDSIV